MKLKTKGMILIAAFGLMCGNAGAMHLQVSPEIIKVDNNDQWVLIQNENGIKTFLATHQENGNSYLKIKFENTTNTTANITWSLSEKGKTILGEHSNKIDPLKTIEIYDATMLVPVSGGTALADFSVTIH